VGLDLADPRATLVDIRCRLGKPIDYDRYRLS
jgi:hypothetical protein